MKKITQDLNNLSDAKLKKFIQKLVPNREKDTFLGIRNPVLRIYSKNMDQKMAKDFMNELPHFYYEENLLHRYLIENINDYDYMIVELNKLLPFLDSWGETDGFKNKSIKKHKNEFFNEINKWLISNHEFTIRFAICCLITYFLDNDFKVEYLELVANINSENKYYIEMAEAWFYSEALIKHFEETLNFLKKTKINDFVFNKSIQKAIESFRISLDKKEYLKTLKRK